MSADATHCNDGALWDSIRFHDYEIFNVHEILFGEKIKRTYSPYVIETENAY